MKPPAADPRGGGKRPQPGRVRAVFLAVLVHALFFAVIIFGVNWQSQPTAPVQAELWDKLPPAKAVEPAKPPEPEPPKAEPKPEPPKPEPKPEPPPKAEPPKPDPQIALKAEREKRERLERAKAEERRKAEERKKAEEKKADDKRKADEKKKADDKKKD